MFFQTIQVYFHLNIDTRFNMGLINLFLSEHVPRISAVLAAILLADTVFQPGMRRTLNIAWTFLILGGFALSLTPWGLRFDMVSGTMVLGPAVYVSNTIYLCSMIYSILVSFFRLKPLTDQPLDRFIRFWVVASTVSIPGFIVDFVIYPNLSASQTFTFPLMAFYRIYFLVISIVSVIAIIRHTLFLFSHSRDDKVLNIDKFSSQYGLSNREREIIPYILDGATNQDISDRLYVSLNTVKTHVYNIFQKTGSGNRIELINLVQGKRPSGGSDQNYSYH